MELVRQLFGEGKDLNVLQMCCRGFVVFLVAYLLIRLSGRRSFGIHSPLDNIIAILLGAVLSRAVVGASPFIPVIAVCLLIVLLHRLLTWFLAYERKTAKWIEGEKILLFANGSFIEKNLERALLCREDVLQGIRRTALTEDLSEVDKVYMERNGAITTVKKKEQA